eukprot:COSAG02_NODE_41933_length_389_cov_1.024138_1_plen_105_part_01
MDAQQPVGPAEPKVTFEAQADQTRSASDDDDDDGSEPAVPANPLTVSTMERGDLSVSTLEAQARDEQASPAAYHKTKAFEVLLKTVLATVDTADCGSILEASLTE